MEVKVHQLLKQQAKSVYEREREKKTQSKREKPERERERERERDGSEFELIWTLVVHSCIYD